MAREKQRGEMQGIEVFGSQATTIDASSRAKVPRTPALGAASLIFALLAAVVFVAARVQRELGDPFATLFSWVALGASALAILGGLLALLTGRGRRTGLLAVLIGTAANPWIMAIVLRYLATLPAS